MNCVAAVGIVGDSVFMPVDHFHEGGETLEALSFFREPGGKGFNQALAAARFGAEATFIGAIGNDGYAHTVRTFLTKDSVKDILVEKPDSSAYAVILTDKTGTNHVTEYVGACLCPEDVPLFEKVIGEADCLLLSNEIPLEVNLACMRIAKANHTIVIYNPAPAKELPDELKQMVDWFTPNEYELSRVEDCPNCIVTLGEKGCHDRMHDISYPAEKVQAVDTTGAGDTFNGVLAAMLAQNASLDEAIRMAVKASGKSVTRKGAAGSVPYRCEVE